LPLFGWCRRAWTSNCAKVESGWEITILRLRRMKGIPPRSFAERTAGVTFICSGHGGGRPAFERFRPAAAVVPPWPKEFGPQSIVRDLPYSHLCRSRHSGSGPRRPWQLCRSRVHRARSSGSRPSLYSNRATRTQRLLVSLTRAAEPGELPPPGIALSALTRHATASGTLRGVPINFLRLNRANSRVMVSRRAPINCTISL
jgi:hypothetical protein